MYCLNEIYEKQLTVLGVKVQEYKRRRLAKGLKFDPLSIEDPMIQFMQTVVGQQMHNILDYANCHRVGHFSNVKVQSLFESVISQGSDQIKFTPNQNNRKSQMINTKRSSEEIEFDTNSEYLDQSEKKVRKSFAIEQEDLPRIEEMPQVFLLCDFSMLEFEHILEVDQSKFIHGESEDSGMQASIPYCLPLDFKDII
mmetsp:Transcript_1993/g.3510  ORF Transcript_1993/g.3510 Transcript_1993/m.3510 type:complete len:197 (+) Transcript_1993:1323-1913(+)